MRPTFATLLAALACIPPLAWCADAAPAPEDLYQRLAPSVWLVEADPGERQGKIGSAVVIGPEQLVTNCHVIDKAGTLFVVHEGRRWRATLQYRDPVRDICQLRAQGLAAPAAPVASAATLRPGAKVFAIGNPRGLELTFSDGLVSGLRHDREGQLQYIQISVPISPGSSGGGLFDAQGRLVGITTAGLRDSQNINFALPSDWIAELPRRVADAMPGTTPPAAVVPADARFAGRWSGSYRCSAYTGTSPTTTPGPWTLPVQMVVDGSRASLARGDTKYSESLLGTVMPDGTLALRGQGAMVQTRNYPWTTQFQGRFMGNLDRFEASGNQTGWNGVVSRTCNLELVKVAAP